MRAEVLLSSEEDLNRSYNPAAEPGWPSERSWVKLYNLSCKRKKQR